MKLKTSSVLVNILMNVLEMNLQSQGQNLLTILSYSGLSVRTKAAKSCRRIS